MAVSTAQHCFPASSSEAQANKAWANGNRQSASSRGSDRSRRRYGQSSNLSHRRNNIHKTSPSDKVATNKSNSHQSKKKRRNFRQKKSLHRLSNQPQRNHQPCPSKTERVHMEIGDVPMFELKQAPHILSSGEDAEMTDVSMTNVTMTDVSDANVEMDLSLDDGDLSFISDPFSGLDLHSSTKTEIVNNADVEMDLSLDGGDLSRISHHFSSPTNVEMDLSLEDGDLSYISHKFSSLDLHSPTTTEMNLDQDPSKPSIDESLDEIIAEGQRFRQDHPYFSHQGPYPDLSDQISNPHLLDCPKGSELDLDQKPSRPSIDEALDEIIAEGRRLRQERRRQERRLHHQIPSRPLSHQISSPHLLDHPTGSKIWTKSRRGRASTRRWTRSSPRVAAAEATSKSG